MVENRQQIYGKNAIWWTSTKEWGRHISKPKQPVKSSLSIQFYPVWKLLWLTEIMIVECCTEHIKGDKNGTTKFREEGKRITWYQSSLKLHQGINTPIVLIHNKQLKMNRIQKTRLIQKKKVGKVKRDHNLKHGYVLTLKEKELLET